MIHHLLQSTTLRYWNFEEYNLVNKNFQARAPQIFLARGLAVPKTATEENLPIQNF